MSDAEAADAMTAAAGQKPQAASAGKDAGTAAAFRRNRVCSTSNWS